MALLMKTTKALIKKFKFGAHFVLSLLPLQFSFQNQENNPLTRVATGQPTHIAHLKPVFTRLSTRECGEICDDVVTRHETINT